MTVSLDLDLAAKDVHSELGLIEEELEGLGENFELGDLNLDGLTDTLDEIDSKLDELGTDLADDLDEVADRFEDMDVGGNGTVGGGDGDSGGDTGSDSGDEKSWKEVFEKAQQFSGTGSFENLFETINEQHKFDDDTAEKVQNAIDDVFGEDFGFEVDQKRTQERSDGKIYGQTDYGTTSFRQHSQRQGFGSGIDVDSPEVSGFDKKNSNLADLPGEGTIHNRMEGMANPISKAIPSMSAWINLMAAALPAMAAFAVQAGGVAAAMGAVGAAGAAMIGLGLVGHGDSMAESMENAKKQVNQLKKDLFQTFEPAADVFASTQSAFFDFAPKQLGRVSKALKGLTAYEDSIFSLFRGGTQWASRFVNMMVANAGVVQQLTSRFSRLIGNGILKFMQWLVNAGYKNQDMLVQMALIAKDVAISFWNIFNAASKLLVVFRPVFGMLKGITNLLNNSLIFGILSAVAAFAMFAYGAVSAAGAVSSLITTITAGMIPGLSAAFAMLQGYVFNALMATSATYTFAQSIATLIATATLLTGIGLAAWAGYQAYQGMQKVNDIKSQMGKGGMPSGGGGGYGRGGSTNIINEGDKYDININGNTDESTRQQAWDVVKVNNKTDDSRSLNLSSSSSSGS